MWVGLLLIHANVWKMSCGVHVSAIFQSAHLSLRQTDKEYRWWMCVPHETPAALPCLHSSAASAPWISFQCWSQCLLLFIYTVGLNHWADVQFNVMDINHYALYNTGIIMQARVYVPGAKAPSPASHYSRCVRTRVTRTAHKPGGGIGGLPLFFLKSSNTLVSTHWSGDRVQD